MTGTGVTQSSQHKIAEAKLKHALFLKSQPRYSRQGECIRCGWCCMHEGTDGGPCEHLKKEGEIYTCLLFNSPDRPQKCGLFPSAPPILHKGCGYYFIDRWDGNKRLGVKEI